MNQASIPMRNSRLTRLAPAFITLLALTPALPADELSELRDQLKALEQKILVLERKQELKDETAATAAKAAPKITAGDGRIEIASGDGANSLRLRGLVQADYRWYDAANDPADTFLVRRARLIVEGRFNQLFSYVVRHRADP
jgi:phosphate-selective porin OprO/OprP